MLNTRKRRLRVGLVRLLDDPSEVPGSTSRTGIVFPTAAAIAAAPPVAIAALGMPLQRARSIVALARAVDRGDLRLDGGAPVEATLDVLRSLPGIGEWTAQYVAMRALAWPDAYPHTALGVMKALGERNPRAVLERAESWRPWRAYAVMHLWRRAATGERR